MIAGGCDSDKLEDFAWVVDASVEVVCDPDDVDPFPEGTPVWSTSDIMQCAAACPDGDPDCLAQCPGRAEHLMCVADSLDSCLSQPEADCRAPWGTYVCCSQDNCDAKLPDAELEACIEENCADQLAVFTNCVDDVLVNGPDTCVVSARRSCLRREQELDGGTDASTDAEVDGDAGLDGGADAETDAGVDQVSDSGGFDLDAL